MPEPVAAGSGCQADHEDQSARPLLAPPLPVAIDRGSPPPARLPPITSTSGATSAAISGSGLLHVTAGTRARRYGGSITHRDQYRA